VGVRQEAVLMIVNDLLQGTTGSDECLEDKRRGLLSYEALRTRLTDSALTQKTLQDPGGPVIRLNALTPEDRFVLLTNIALVHANGIPEKVREPDAGIVATLRKANQTLGSEYLRIDSKIVRTLLILLNYSIKTQQRTGAIFPNINRFMPPDPLSIEEELANGRSPPAPDEDLASREALNQRFLFPGWFPLFTNWMLRFRKLIGN
jgi:hypothetical protein